MRESETAEWERSDEYRRASHIFKEVLVRLRDLLESRKVGMARSARYGPFMSGADAYAMYSRSLPAGTKAWVINLTRIMYDGKFPASVWWLTYLRHVRRTGWDDIQRQTTGHVSLFDLKRLVRACTYHLVDRMQELDIPVRP